MSTNPNLPQSKIKFRPSLTAGQIEHIIHILSTAGENSPLNQSCLKSLRMFSLKAQHGIVSPSHLALGRESLEASLGFSQDAPAKTTTVELLYQVWQTHPTTLTPAQLHQVQSYRYQNNLMSPEEEQEYDMKILGV